MSRPAPPAAITSLVLAGPDTGGGWSLTARVGAYLLVLLPAAGLAVALGAALATGGGGGRVVLRLTVYALILAACFGAAFALGSLTSPGWLS
jgi:hypothetical protein